jgi:hypothetical protein
VQFDAPNGHRREERAPQPGSVCEAVPGLRFAQYAGYAVNEHCPLLQMPGLPKAVAANPRRIEELSRFSEMEVLNVRGVGERSIEYISNYLGERGLSFNG